MSDELQRHAHHLGSELRAGVREELATLRRAVGKRPAAMPEIVEGVARAMEAAALEYAASVNNARELTRIMARAAIEAIDEARQEKQG